MKTQKGFAPILIAIIAGVILLSGGGAYYFSKQNKSPDFTDLMKGLSAKIPKLETDTKQENPPVVNNNSTSTISNFETVSACNDFSMFSNFLILDFKILYRL